MFNSKISSSCFINSLSNVYLQAPGKHKKAAYSMDTLSRGKRSVAIDLKQAEGVKVVRKLCSNADVLIEPFRPGKEN